MNYKLQYKISLNFAMIPKNLINIYVYFYSLMHIEENIYNSSLWALFNNQYKYFGFVKYALSFLVYSVHTFSDFNHCFLKTKLILNSSKYRCFGHILFHVLGHFIVLRRGQIWIINQLLSQSNANQFQMNVKMARDFQASLSFLIKHLLLDWYCKVLEVILFNSCFKSSVKLNVLTLMKSLSILWIFKSFLSKSQFDEIIRTSTIWLAFV